MYIYKRRSSAYRGIATFAMLALLAWILGGHMHANLAHAENLTSVSDTLSDSAPDEASNHTIAFTIPNGALSGQTITIDFPVEFTNLGSIVEDDVDVDVNGSASSTAAGPGAGTFGVGVAGQILTLTVGTEGLASSSALEVRVGTNAVDSGTGANQIVNPTATTSYEIPIAGTMTDSGNARVAIIENVLVTADINTTLTFNIYGTSTGAVCNGAAATFATSTNTALPFGNLQPATPKVLCQDLTVATNALNGYIVTVEQDTQFDSSTGADIDGFADGAWDDAPAAWASPGNNVLDEDTWGHWGLTSTDDNTLRTGGEFSSDNWVSASTTPTVIMGHTGASDGSTIDIGRASIAYQVEITALQEAGDDYETTLTYIATPTF